MAAERANAAHDQAASLAEAEVIHTPDPESHTRFAAAGPLPSVAHHEEAPHAASASDLAYGAQPVAAHEAAKPVAAHDAAKPEAVHEAAKPEAAKPEAAKPEAAKPEAVEAKPEAEAAKAETKPEAKPEAKPETEDGPVPYISGDIMYEQLAHRFAYRDKLTATDHDWLRTQGLQAGKVVKGKNGFSMIAFTPLPGYDGLRRPVLAFRGSDDLSDALDDFNSHGVGAAQMAANEGLIGAALVGLQQYMKEPAVTGHSLGGSLAQMAAARYPDLVAKVVTFQSPGISADMAEHVTDANKESNAEGKGDTVVSHHYQVNGDAVGKTGEALTPGEVSDIQRPTGYLLKHTGYVTDYADKHPESATKSDSKDRMPGKLEGLRAGFGKFLGAIQKVTHTGPEQYIEVWEQVRDAIDRDAKPGEIQTIIDHSKMSGDDKSWMREQLNDTLAANAYEAHHEKEPDIATAE